MGYNNCICGCDSKYERCRIEQYINASDQMIDDPIEREGFQHGIECVLNELDMMMPKETVWEPQMQEKTPVEQGWELVQMLSDRAKDQNLFGQLVDDHNGYKFKVEAWKGDWNQCPPEEEPTPLKVNRVSSWRLDEWNGDETGGPGLLITSTFESPKGKTYQFNVVIPKDDLIKALASLVQEDGLTKFMGE